MISDMKTILKFIYNKHGTPRIKNKFQIIKTYRHLNFKFRRVNGIKQRLMDIKNQLKEKLSKLLIH